MKAKPGDVIIFEAGDDWVGKSIALLTHSNVSHSAMVFNADSIAEVGSHGAQINNCKEDPSGEKVYLLRLDPEKDPSPLVKTAQAYVDQGVKYDFPDLVILAGLLIYRSIRPTPRWKKITDTILNLACKELDKFLNRLIHQGQDVPVMVCSQFVYQCYLDCGKDYKIILKDALLQAAPEMLDSGCIRLADLAAEVSSDFTVPAFTAPAETNLENLARELYESVIEAESNDMLLSSTELSDTLGAVARFLDIVENILERAKVEVPVPALFVAPSDLLEHAVNLKQYGTANLLRVM